MEEVALTELSALPATTHPWSALMSRDDLILEDGFLRLVHDDVTPEDAMAEDLEFVADVLERAGIALTLVRDERLRPVVVIDGAVRAEAIDALAASASTEPFYAKVRQIGAAAALRDGRPRARRLGGHRSSARASAGTGRCATAPSSGCGSSSGGSAARRSRRRARTPSRGGSSPTEDLAYTSVERYGRTWRTLEGMFDRHPREVTEDIDMVFSWVDGSSSEFQRQRALQMQEYVVGEGDDGDTRYRHVDELRYALRSVHMYAPWVRRIFIATDSERPAWLAEHPKVTVVRSEEFFADPGVLPTHNSHAVESQLHRIDGLAERFLYSNDDMFFGRPVTPELFFTSGGLSTFVEAPVRIGVGPRAHAPQRSRQWPAREPRPPAGALRSRHHARSAALRGADAPQHRRGAGAGVRRGLRPHGRLALPLGDRHLGDQQPLPLLRAPHGPGPARRRSRACSTSRPR